MDIEREFKRINAQYPWAKEASMLEALRVQGIEVTKRSKLVKMLKEKDTDLDDFVKDAKKNYTVLNRKIRSFDKIAANTIKDFTAATDPIQGTAGLMQNLGHATEGAGAALKNDISGRLRNTSAGTLDTFGATMVTTGAVIAQWGAVVNEQTKATRAFIDYGMLAFDLEFYDGFRSEVNDMGISVNEAMQEFSDMIPVFANMHGSTLGVFTSFLNSTDTLFRQDVISQFGYNNREARRAIANDLNALYRFNAVQELDNYTITRMAQRFDENARIGLVLAETLGLSRSEFESLRSEAVDDLDFQHSMLRNQQYIVETFGAEVYENLIAGNQNIRAILTATLGKDFATQTSELLTRGIYDIHANTTLTDNITGDLNLTLDLLGQDVKNEYFNIMESYMRGELSGVDLNIRLRDFARMIGDAPTRPIDHVVDYTNRSVLHAMEIYARAQTIPDTFLEASREELDRIISNADYFAENADDSVQAVDNMRIMMREVYDTITPSFRLTSMSISGFGTAISTVNELMSSAFGPITSAVVPELESLLSAPSDIERASEETGVGYNPIHQRPSASSRLGASTPVGAGTGYTGPHRPRDMGSSNVPQIGDITLSSGGEYGINTNDAMSPIFDMTGASFMTQAIAPENMDRLLRGPYARLQEYFGGPVQINDAIAKAGTSRETETQGSQHFSGNALDLNIAGMSNEEKSRLVHAALAAGFSGFGFGENILHVDVGPRRSWQYSDNYAGIPASAWRSFVATNDMSAFAGYQGAFRNVELGELTSEFNIDPNSITVPESISEVSATLIDAAGELVGLSERANNAELRQYFASAGYNVDPAVTPWCAYFVSATLRNMGIEPAELPSWSRSYLEWGRAVNPEQAQAGDIVVFSRGNDPNKGHVGIFLGYTASGDLRVLGGNQGDSVKESVYRRSSLLGVRRATEAMLPSPPPPPPPPVESTETAPVTVPELVTSPTPSFPVRIRDTVYETPEQLQRKLVSTEAVLDTMLSANNPDSYYSTIMDLQRLRDTLILTMNDRNIPVDQIIMPLAKPLEEPVDADRIINFQSLGYQDTFYSIHDAHSAKFNYMALLDHPMYSSEAEQFKVQTVLDALDTVISEWEVWNAEHGIVDEIPTGITPKMETYYENYISEQQAAEREELETTISFLDELHNNSIETLASWGKINNTISNSEMIDTSIGETSVA